MPSATDIPLERQDLAFHEALIKMDYVRMGITAH